MTEGSDMLAATLHREDIKAILRKRHGTIVRFADARGLSKQSVADFMRGRTSARVADAIEAELLAAQSEEQSIKVDNSDADTGTHRLNAGAR